jgi:hypothetical protein
MANSTVGQANKTDALFSLRLLDWSAETGDFLWLTSCSASIGSLKSNKHRRFIRTQGTTQ